MNIDFTSMAIVATAVSVIISFIKHYAGTSGTKANIIAVAVSVVAAAIYTVLKNTLYWQTFVEILGFANIIYLVLVQHVDTQIQNMVNSSPTVPVPPQTPQA